MWSNSLFNPTHFISWCGQNLLNPTHFITWFAQILISTPPTLFYDVDKIFFSTPPSWFQDVDKLSSQPHPADFMMWTNSSQPHPADFMMWTNSLFNPTDFISRCGQTLFSTTTRSTNRERHAMSQTWLCTWIMWDSAKYNVSLLTRDSAKYSVSLLTRDNAKYNVNLLTPDTAKYNVSLLTHDSAIYNVNLLTRDSVRYNVNMLTRTWFASFLTHDTKLKIALNSGLNESSGFMSDTSVKRKSHKKAKDNFGRSHGSHFLMAPVPFKGISYDRILL